METRTFPSSRDLSPGMSIIHSNRMARLRQVAVGWIGSHPLNVLETELFIVQSSGMAQWLKLALAADEGCGISAGLDVQLPGRFVWTAYRSVLGDDTIPEDSPYDRERLIWRLFRLLPVLGNDPVFDPLTRFMAPYKDRDQDPYRDPRRLSQLSACLADLYDQYQVYRADWLEDWAEGRDCLARIGKPPAALPRDHLWQAELWRRLRDDLPEALRRVSRSDLHGRFLKAAKALGDRRPGGMPPRIIVFGLSSLPRQVIETLHGVSGFCQVLLFVQNPCRHFWADIVEDRELIRIAHARHQTKETMPDPLTPEQLHLHANPLLAAWGKQGRDYIGLLYGYDHPEDYEQDFGQIDLFEDLAAGPGRGTLLQQVQQAVLDLTPPPEDPDLRPTVPADDRSIGFGEAHSRQRETEVLQDRLLDCFETLDDLTPGQIMVMTPDIEAYAPHIEAVFGNLEPDDPRYIPFTVADKPDRESMPLLKALDRLLNLPESRMGVSDLVDLLEVDAFRARFGLEASDLPRLNQWIRGAGISWGLNSRQREGFGLQSGLDQNTWAFGLNRMLLGYAVGKGRPWQGIEPYDEVGGLDAALVGPLSTVVHCLDDLGLTLSRPAPPRIWRDRIRQMVSDCFLAQNSLDRLILNRLEEGLDTWLDACVQAGLETDLSLAVVREHLMARMTEASISQRFLAGMVNFGTLMPMRAIPFRVVCLLGMNDGEFPRSRPPLDVDLMAGRGLYRPGDRSRREDDRYLFLEALLSAKERLYISHVGRDIRDNSPRMPSVLVGQLRDYLSAGWRPEHPEVAETLAQTLTRVYPLQPFARAYFSGTRPGLYTYAREWRRALENREAAPRDQVLSPPEIESEIGLGDLVRFMVHPVRYFYNRRLTVRFHRPEESRRDLEPFELDTLSAFGPGMRLLEAGLAVPPGEAAQAVSEAARRLTRTGELPMAGFGRLAAEELAGPVSQMLARHHHLLDRWPLACDPLEISIALDNAASLEDWLDRIHSTLSSDASGFARWTFYPKPIMGTGGKVARLHSLVALWVAHVAASAQDTELTSLLVAPDGAAAFDPMPRTRAEEILTEMIRAWERGMTYPLPVTSKTGLAYAGACLDKDEDHALEQARKVYAGDGFRSGGELGYDRYLQLAFPDFDTLCRAYGNGFTELAHGLYAPLARAVRAEDLP